MNDVVVIGGMDANVQHAFRGGAVAGGKDTREKSPTLSLYREPQSA